MTQRLDVVARARVACPRIAPWLILACIQTAAAAESPANAPHFSMSPQALHAAASAVQPPEGSAISVVELQETYSFEADGSNLYTQYLVYKVLSPAAADSGWNELRKEWSPWRADKPTMRARVIAPDGTTFTLDPATIADSPVHATDSTIYSDDRVLRAPLPAFAPGAVVETEIVIRERLPFKGAGDARRTYFQLWEPIHHMRVTLEAPDSIPLRHRLDAAPDVKMTRTAESGRQRWVFDGGPITENDDYVGNAPADFYQRATLTFSTGASWQELAQAYAGIVEERLATANVDEIAARLTKGRSSREDKIAALVAYLNREIRYTGIEFDESSVVPHSPAETLNRRYGDCKDKALLLVALLRAVDVTANLALLNAGDELDVVSDLPGMGHFNHAIVHVPGEAALWIDATAETSRLGQLPDADRGRLALIIDTRTTALTPIPEARSTDNVIEESREIRLADYGPASVVEISTPLGNYEANYRYIYADAKAKATVEQLTDYMKTEYSAERMSKFDRSDPKDFSQPFRLTVEGAKAQRGFTSLTDARLYIPIGGLFHGLPYDLRTREPTDEENAKATRPAKKRTIDYVVPRPFSAIRHYRIVPPAGFQASSLPESATRALGPAEFSESYTVDADGAVRAEIRFDIKKRRFTPEEQRKLRAEVAQLLDRQIVLIKFDLRAHALFTQGQAPQSFQAYRDLVAQHPKDPIQHLRRARALLDAGMGDAARTEVAAAIKLDPKLALAYELQAAVLQYDLIGRWRVEGADFAGATAAYKKAISLDPDKHAYVGDLAVLLEHNRQGIRYGRGADLTGAIATYRKLTAEKRQEIGLGSNLSFALFYDGQYAAALEAANTIDSPPLALLIACDAQLNGVTHALAEAQRRSTNKNSYKQIAADAGQLLMAKREYQNAAALLEAGANGANTAQTMALAGMLRQAKRHEEVPAGAGPDGFLRKSMVNMIAGSATTDELEGLGSRSYLRERASLSAEQRRETDYIDTLRAILQRTGMPLDVIADIVQQSIQIKATGDDATGYRLSLQVAGTPAQVVFVVKEDGNYRVLANAWLPPVATEAVDRAQRGDLATAGTLFGWVRESISNRQDVDDPYAAEPFTRFWSLGQRQGDANAIQLAAASLWVTAPSAARRGVEVLEKARTGADSQLEAIELALLVGYESLNDHERALETAQALAKRSPLSQRAFWSQARHLRALNRFKEADLLAEERLKKLPDDIDALRVLAANSFASRDYATAYSRALKVLADPRSATRDMNQIAWISLFFDREGGPDVENAERAAQSNSMEPLHTLGCAYAEIGKTREAREVLLQSMVARGIVEPTGDFWYAFGRIAEQYGERDIARANYAKVKPPEDASTSYQSSYELAQQRMKVLARK
jgi:transglutaminase-like putative cysteine protease